ncbi:MAG: hypothetical protein SPG13_03775 [Peptostreptococcus porci]|uniref:Uncharacterized protein n=1 Tax=Peptostreptococcus porci TaxID=2652282 RepID=A0A6N7XEB8_9FIRM|nr:hypothetical protein [Peptostreptococcus porci]MDD7182801.1 hypothetical protein [Peptostreptococcus porci]MDY4127448.1 hypothetical protein [Peptostreptococcus porci]MDY5479559.1 hypothetical protein [Peptostreptococcus porci]MDY5963671.1 hypothetical protein [Peptostreptococcus porci]MDY6230805.1 hypothetical protein [Peptostreptococcus porci]
MTKTGLIILGILLVFFLYCCISNTLAKNYVVRNVVGIYVLILGILSVIRSASGVIHGFYLGIVAIILSFLSLIVFKKDYNKCRIINIIALIISSIGTYFAYIR